MTPEQHTKFKFNYNFWSISCQLWCFSKKLITAVCITYQTTYSYAMLLLYILHMTLYNNLTSLRNFRLQKSLHELSLNSSWVSWIVEAFTLISRCNLYLFCGCGPVDLRGRLGSFNSTCSCVDT